MLLTNFKRHDELLKFIVDYRLAYASQPTFHDMAQALSMSYEEICEGLRMLQCNGKIVIQSLGICKPSLIILGGPAMNNGSSLTSATLHDFGACRAMKRDGRVTVEVHRTFVRSVDELRRLAERLLAASDQLESQ